MEIAADKRPLLAGRDPVSEEAESGQAAGSGDADSEDGHEEAARARAVTDVPDVLAENALEAEVQPSEADRKEDDVPDRDEAEEGQDARDVSGHAMSRQATRENGTDDKVSALMRELEADLKELREMLLAMRGSKEATADRTPPERKKTAEEGRAATA